MRHLAQATALLVLLSYLPNARADSFGTGANSFQIDFVPIGNAGNSPDTTGVPNPAGAVSDTYRIGKFEISENVINQANAASAGTADPLSLTHSGRGANKPATSISWIEATTFVNWLNTSTGNMPAYKFDGLGNFQLWEAGDTGFDPANPYRNTQAKYFLPSADEWYKAAFFNPTSSTYNDYPTGSDIAPTAVSSGTTPGTAVYDQSFATGPADVNLAGGLSPFGTIGQGGNALEWEETDFDLVNDSVSSFRGARGGTWADSESQLSSTFRGFLSPTFEINTFGFRVASKTLAGDFDLDGDADGADFLLWQRGESPNALSSGDLAAWTADYNNSGAALAAISVVPEPGSMALALFAALGFAMQRAV